MNKPVFFPFLALLMGLCLAGCDSPDSVDRLCISILDELNQPGEIKEPFSASWTIGEKFRLRVEMSDLPEEDKQWYRDRRMAGYKKRHAYQLHLRHAQRVEQYLWEKLGEPPWEYLGYEAYALQDSSDISRIARVDMLVGKGQQVARYEVDFLESLGAPYVLYGVFLTGD